ncbi:MAG TPA: hypothetical protein VIR57_11340 [Chloroflexota bacterium]
MTGKPALQRGQLAQQPLALDQQLAPLPQLDMVLAQLLPIMDAGQVPGMDGGAE